MSEEIVLEVVPDVVPPDTPTEDGKVVLGEPIVRSVSVLAFHLRVLDLLLGKSVRFAIYLDCESEGKVFRDYKEIVIEGEDYLAWGTDDKYVLDLVKSKLASVL